jgi:hypothetical protein
VALEKNKLVFYSSSDAAYFTFCFVIVVEVEGLVEAEERATSRASLKITS